MFFGDETAQGGEGGAGAATRRQGDWTAAEGVASVDVIVPDGCGRRRARKELLTFSLPIKSAALCHGIVCVCSLSCSRFRENVFLLGHHQMAAGFFGRRSECALLVKQENLAQLDEAWIKTSSLRCYKVFNHL